MSNTPTACFSAALTTEPLLDDAIDDLLEKLDVSARPADVVLFFATPDYRDRFGELAARLSEHLGTQSLIGCTAESVIAGEQEVEEGPAIAVWIARIPGVELSAHHLQFESTPDGPSIIGWPSGPQELDHKTVCILIGDPFSFPAEALLEGFNDEYPGLPIVGGMASGGAAPGENRLAWGRAIHADGALLLCIRRGLRLRTVLSQGCRPIGPTFVITKAEANVIYELGGRPALLQLKELFDQLPVREQQMVQRALHLGRVVDEYQDQRGQGDFLVRNVHGLDGDSGGITVGDYMRIGQTVQFHIRDEESASAELAQLLANVRDDGLAVNRGVLLFSCNGRGTRLFSEPHHDATAIQQRLGSVPLAGFFAMGEIGPVAKQNYMHGFTASIALLEPTEEGE